MTTRPNAFVTTSSFMQMSGLNTCKCENLFRRLGVPGKMCRLEQKNLTVIKNV